ncbi:MAG: V-type ATP synthase subunit I domain-containing protein, partial [Planctomycetota bacterium]
MAISQMAKVLIVSHRTEAAKLLEAMQNEGICQILNAEEAMVSKQWPELNVAADRPRQSEQLLEGLNKAATFLKDYAQIPKGAVSALAPRMVVGQQMYEDAVADEKLLEIATQAQQVETTIEQLKTEIENLQGVLTHLEPWQGLDTPVEQIGQLETTICMPGLLPSQYVGEIKEKLAELDSFLETVGESGSNLACIVICLKGQAVDVQKLLRSVDFESVSFEPMVGTVAELVEQNREKLNQTHSQLESQYEQAKSLAENLLGLQILCDHYGNLLSQQQSRSDSPATEHTVLFEGWVKKRDYKRLEKVVSGFSASSLSKM